MGTLGRQISEGRVGAEAADSGVMGSVKIRGCKCSVKQGDLLRASWLRV